MDKIFAYLFGFASGFFVCKYFLEKHYTEIANQEIDSVKEHFEKMEEDRVKSEKYRDVISENRYGSVEWNELEEKSDDILSDEEDSIKIIDPEDFGEKLDYEEDSIVILDDGTVLDGNGNMMSEDEINDCFGGRAILKEAEKRSPNLLYIVNEKLKSYYEIEYVEGDYEEYSGR